MHIPIRSSDGCAGPVYALGYAVLAVFGASLVAILTAFPEALIVTIAGIALIGPFVASLSASLDGEEQFTAAATFVVTASGVSFFGLGSAFWGLAAGLAVLALGRREGGGCGMTAGRRLLVTLALACVGAFVEDPALDLRIPAAQLEVVFRQPASRRIGNQEMTVAVFSHDMGNERTIA